MFSWWATADTDEPPHVTCEDPYDASAIMEWGAYIMFVQVGEVEIDEVPAKVAAHAVAKLDPFARRTMPLLEEWGIPTRLTSLQGYEGCFDGYVTVLADAWLHELPLEELGKTEVFACGPTPMLRAVADLAAKYDLPCQVSLEEYMACAVGGCAGCAVKIMTPEGEAMKRVCVDGPVFDGDTVF